MNNLFGFTEPIASGLPLKEVVETEVRNGATGNDLINRVMQATGGVYKDKPIKAETILRLGRGVRERMLSEG